MENAFQLHENVRFSRPELGMLAGLGQLSLLDNMTGICHWHEEIEIVYVQEGSMDYFVDGKTMRLDPGDGLFVAPGQLHLAIPTHQGDCSFYLLIISNALFDTGVTNEIHRAASNGLLFHRDGEAWEQSTIREIESLYHCYRGDYPTAERLHSHVVNLTEGLRDHLVPAAPEQPAVNPALNTMLCYIHDNFQKKLTLAEIAEVGRVSRTTCYNLFHTNLGQAPAAYINYYRLNRSLELLKNTDQRLSEIAYSCGFNSHSYYAEAFHKQFGVTPKEYRKAYTE